MVNLRSYLVYDFAYLIFFLVQEKYTGNLMGSGRLIFVEDTEFESKLKLVSS